MFFGYIYKTTFPNGKVYIGKKHKSVFDPKYFGSGKAVCDYKKSKGSFIGLSVEVVCWAKSLEELNQQEEFEIFNARTLFGRKCLNIMDGADGFSPKVAKELRARSDIKLATSNYTKKLWSDPNYVSKNMASRAKTMATSEYKQMMSNLKSLGKNGRAKKTICLDTGEVFSCTIEANRYLNSHNAAEISCRNYGKRVKGHRFMWLKDFENLSKLEQKQLLVDRRKEEKIGGRARKVICVETGILFQSISRAIEWCGGDVYQALIKNMKAGGYRWMYYDDWVKTQKQAA